MRMFYPVLFRPWDLRLHSWPALYLHPPRTNSPSTPMRVHPPTGSWSCGEEGFRGRMRLRCRFCFGRRRRRAAQSRQAGRRVDQGRYRLGLDTNLTAEAKASGLFVRMAWWLKTTCRRLERRYLRPYDYGYFAVVYDTEKLKNPPKSLKELVEGNAAEQDRHPGSAHVDAGLGLLLWVKSVYGDKRRKPGPS